MKKLLTILLLLAFVFSVNAADTFRVIRNGDLVKTTAPQLGYSVVNGTESKTSVNAALSVILSDSVLNDTDSTSEVVHTLADGVAGQIKYIVAQSVASNNAVQISNFASGTTLNFNAAGDAATLKFNGAQWYLVGQNSITIE